MGLRDWPQFWNNSNPIKLKSSWILELFFFLILLLKKIILGSWNYQMHWMYNWLEERKKSYCETGQEETEA